MTGTVPQLRQRLLQGSRDIICCSPGLLALKPTYGYKSKLALTLGGLSFLFQASKTDSQVLHFGRPAEANGEPPSWIRLDIIRAPSISCVDGLGPSADVAGIGRFHVVHEYEAM